MDESDKKEENKEVDILDQEDEFSEGILEISDFDNIALQVVVQLGRCELKIKDILSLEKGSVIDIEKLAGEPLEFFMGDKLTARGEVIVVNEKYGLRLTDIIDLEENS
jgi:flagellar motor switch protein FliN/FliY